MTALVRVQPGALPAVSQPLVETLAPREAARYHDGSDEAPFALAIPPASPSASAVAEARRVLPAYEAACRAPSLRVVQDWLTPLAGAVANRPSETEVTLRARLLCVACEDLPAAAFSPESEREALRRFKFWPAVAELHALLAEHGAALLRTLAALRRVAEHQAAPAARAEGRPEPTSEERAAVAARLRALREELAARAPAPVAQPGRVLPLSPQALAAAYRAQLAHHDAGMRALAATRLRMLGEDVPA